MIFSLLNCNMYKKVLAITNLVIIVVFIIIIAILGLDIKEPYPRIVIAMWAEPYVRFLALCAIYMLAIYDFTIALLAVIAVLLLHLDYLNLVVA